jgi:hypothetical protein
MQDAVLAAALFLFALFVFVTDFALLVCLYHTR